MKKLNILLLFIFIAAQKLAAQSGCTDTAANNYNSKAKTNNGSCTYNDILITPTTRYNLNNKLRETSGLLWWNDLVWTFNDSGGQPALYAIDSATGNIVKTVQITNASNVDWEDIAQDDNFVYIGDFGNNASGNRKNLRIYKVSKNDINASNAVTATVINFSYSDQTDFTAAAANHTNFDCEAMIAYSDSLFLFSKNWIDFHSRLYALPKTSGTYIAEKRAELNVQGLITGATILPAKKTIVLSGYSTVLSPFVYLLYDFGKNNFFDGNKRKVQLNEVLTQMEGIAFVNNAYFFVSNEFFQHAMFTTPAKLQSIDLSSLLRGYFTTMNNYSTKEKAFKQ